MAPRLVLHIGSHKTGTTTIQHALAANRPLLESHGVHYSQAFGDRPHSVPIMRMFLRDPLSYRHVARQALPPLRLAAAIEADRSALRAEIEAIGDGTLVISGEDIGGLEGDDLDDLAAFCNDHFDDVKVVYVVREPEALVRSIHHQLLRSGEGRADRFRAVAITGRYARVPQRFGAAFGRDRVAVARFEDLLAPDIVRQWCRRFLDIDDARLVGDVRNEGLSSAAVWALRWWNRAVPRERPGIVAVKVARPVRGLLTRLPGRRDLSRPPIDAASAARINDAVARLAEDFGIEPYPAVKAD
ncbi:MAG: hypothetical protein RIB98_09120 [Acidimicrobiales bacterium]